MIYGFNNENPSWERRQEDDNFNLILRNVVHFNYFLFSWTLMELP